MGRVYVAGVFVLAPLGAYVQYLEQLDGVGTPEFTVLATVNVIVLMIPTAIALRYAMRRNITLHRQWMTRSYAVALASYHGYEKHFLALKRLFPVTPGAART